MGRSAVSGASLGLQRAGDWLNTAPLKTLGLHLRGAEFTLVVKYRLGLPVFDSAGPCPACLRHSDVFGEIEAISHLLGRLGVLLQRGNAAILGNRMPAFPGALIDGIL